MLSIKRSFRVASESQIFEGVHNGFWRLGCHSGTQQKRNPLPPPLGVIEVIQAASKGTTINKIGVLTVAPM